MARSKEHVKRGRRSQAKGKEFERYVARALNTGFNLRFKRTRLGERQFHGDLVPDTYRRIPQAATFFARRFEEHAHIECRANIATTLANVLHGRAAPLDRAWKETVGRAATDTREQSIVPVFIFKIKGKAYAQVQTKTAPRFIGQLAPPPGFSAVRGSSYIIYPLEAFILQVERGD